MLRFIFICLLGLGLPQDFTFGDPSDPSMLEQIGEPIAKVELKGGDHRFAEIEIYPWVKALDPSRFVAGNSFAETRLYPRIVSRGNEAWFDLMASFPFYLLLSRMALWVRLSGGESSRFYILGLNLPLTQLRDLLLLGHGERISSVEFLWHPMPDLSAELIDTNPPLLLEVNAEIIRQKILKHGHRIRVVDFLQENAQPNDSCWKHLRHVGWLKDENRAHQDSNLGPSD